MNGERERDRERARERQEAHDYSLRGSLFPPPLRGGFVRTESNTEAFAAHTSSLRGSCASSIISSLAVWLFSLPLLLYSKKLSWERRFILQRTSVLAAPSAMLKIRLFNRCNWVFRRFCIFNLANLYLLLFRWPTSWKFSLHARSTPF